MALTKSDIPDLLLPGLRAEFALAYKNELDNSTAEKLATVISTTQPAQKYAWLGAVPAMREFLDERHPSGLAPYAVTIEDKTFESTIAVDRRAVEDDQLDLIRLRVRDLAFRVGAHRQQMVVQALAGGGSGIGYDGQALFSTAHPVKGGTYSNRTSDAIGADSLSNAMAAMMLTPDDGGTPLGIEPDTLLVGPKIMWEALELVESPVTVYKGTGSAGTSPTPYKNAAQGRLKVVVSPYLADETWYLLDTKRPIRAVILQQRRDVPVEFAALDAGSGSESAFLRDRFLYGVRGRYNVGYGLWQTAFAGGL